VRIDDIWPVRDEAASTYEKAQWIDRWQPIPRRQRDDQIAMGYRQCARCYNQTAVRSTRQCSNGALDVTGVTHINRAYLDPERRCRRLYSGELTDRGRQGWFAKDRRPLSVRRDLFEQLRPFPTDAVFKQGEARGIATRPRQGCDISRANWVNDS